MSPFRIVFGKPGHLLVELKHRVIWAIKTLNLVLEATEVERKLQLSELEEIRTEPMRTPRCTKRERNCFMTDIFTGKSSSNVRKCCFMTPDYTFF